MSAAVWDAPETYAQATAWERVKGNAERHGLCVACAAQYAWGTQLGFARTTRAPCAACAPLVAGLPSPAMNGWRRVEGSAQRVATWRPA